MGHKPAARKTRSVESIEEARTYLLQKRDEVELLAIVRSVKAGCELAETFKADANFERRLPRIYRAILGNKPVPPPVFSSSTAIVLRKGKKPEVVHWKPHTDATVSRIVSLTSKAWKTMGAMVFMFCEDKGTELPSASELVALEVLTALAEPTADFEGRLDTWRKRRPVVKESAEQLRSALLKAK